MRKFAVISNCMIQSVSFSIKQKFGKSKIDSLLFLMKKWTAISGENSSATKLYYTWQFFGALSYFWCKSDKMLPSIFSLCYEIFRTKINSWVSDITVNWPNKRSRGRIIIAFWVTCDEKLRAKVKDVSEVSKKGSWGILFLRVLSFLYQKSCLLTARIRDLWYWVEREWVSSVDRTEML